MVVLLLPAICLSYFILYALAFPVPLNPATANAYTINFPAEDALTDSAHEINPGQLALIAAEEKSRAAEADYLKAWMATVGTERCGVAGGCA